MTEPTELLPTRATYAPTDRVQIEVRGSAGPGELVVLRLGDEVARVPFDGITGVVPLPELGEGCYGVELHAGGAVTRTAVEVRAASRARLRYGFTARFVPDRDPAGLADTARRLHLNGIMFYDWAYRHVSLLGGGEQYEDALGQPVSLDTVRRLASALQRAGSDAIGYAAVYAVAPESWEEWAHDGLYTPTGEPYSLGDFLYIVDPAAPDWLAHFSRELRESVDAVGFDGFHLDQFGYPKSAVRGDGAVVDVAQSFVTMIEGVRSALPDARLVFNNVNDFPTRATGPAPQDAVYIEPWEPNLTLGSLATIVSRARLAGGGKPVVIAAYQHVYDSAPAEASDRATRLTMATLYSRGGTQILAGEDDRILVDPYYVRNHVAEPSTADMLVRWYDFLVEHDEILMDPALDDVTASYAGGYNNDCDVAFDGAVVSEEAVAGAVWRSITAARGRLVVNLINLVGQRDVLWDAPREPFGHPGTGTLRVRRLKDRVPRIRVADPDGSGRLEEIGVSLDGDHAVAALPPLQAWQLILIEL
ncbi:glycoside hydrolase family 66 protein [Salinibacterium soli]|uniref:Glycoside hydrolase family 66 protein n=1 Tax=Antiquaquibacter soli TaxID=3064523 RepID=A0ABT9BW14_9MICO|nr:glycoside hydrolase family 66 protein [Protaetiibacter sp. WY-16]MDO7883585.1 glycoside hydrolase family 66 protein [Protaetiibacter sp. WY-16]